MVYRQISSLLPILLEVSYDEGVQYASSKFSIHNDSLAKARIIFYYLNVVSFVIFNNQLLLISFQESEKYLDIFCILLMRQQAEVEVGFILLT